MKKNIFIFLLCMGFGHAGAQNQLKGNVKNKSTQEPLAGVSVYIPDLKTGTVTDSSGHYILNGLPKGKFLVECRKKDFNTRVITLDIFGEITWNVELDEEVAEIEEITITGTSQSTSRNQNPVAIATMNQQDLFQQTSTNIIDNISKTPGVNQLSTGPAISKPMIRGLGYNRLVTLYNGIRQEGQQWGDEHGIELDEFAIDRVEIIKGPGSLMYGSDAIAGVINFIAPDPLPLGTIKTSVLANYQTNNHLQGYSIANAGNIKGMNWLLRGSTKQAGNYRNAYDGYVYNSGFKEYDLNGYAGVNKSWGYSHVSFSAFDQTVAMTEGDRDSLGNFTGKVKVNDTLSQTISMTRKTLKGYHLDIPSQHIRHYRLTSLSKIFFGSSNLSFNMGYQQNNRREFGDVLMPHEANLFFHLQTIHYDIRYQLPESHQWHLTIGINGIQQSNENRAKEVIIPDYKLFDAGTFVFAKRQLGEKINIAGGIRYDHRNVKSKVLYVDSLGELSNQPTVSSITKFSPINTSFQAVTGSAGVTIAFTEKISAKFNIARGYRAPNMAELGSNGRHEGTLRYEVGNAHLKPETSLQGDLGFNFNTGHISSELSVFYNDIRNYIFTRKLTAINGGDSIADPADPAPVFEYAQGHAFVYGGEFSVDVHPHPFDWLHFENAFSMVTATQLHQPDSMKYMPFIPAPRYQGEVRCEFKKNGKYLRHLYCSAGINHFFKQEKIYSAFHTETTTPAYTLTNTGIGANVVNKKGHSVCTIQLSVINLLDVAYQNNLNRLKYADTNSVTGRTGVFNMGRNFSFKILIPIEKVK